MSDIAELVERLRNKARASFETNKSAGRKGKEWALDSEAEWHAADSLTALQAEVERLKAELTGVGTEKDLRRERDEARATLSSLQSRIDAAEPAEALVSDTLDRLSRNCATLLDGNSNRAPIIRGYMDEAFAALRNRRSKALSDLAETDRDLLGKEDGE